MNMWCAAARRSRLRYIQNGVHAIPIHLSHLPGVARRRRLRLLRAPRRRLARARRLETKPRVPTRRDGERGVRRRRRRRACFFSYRRRRRHRLAHAHFEIGSIVDRRVGRVPASRFPAVRVVAYAEARRGAPPARRRTRRRAPSRGTATVRRRRAAPARAPKRTRFRTRFRGAPLRPRTPRAPQGASRRTGNPDTAERESRASPRRAPRARSPSSRARATR